MPHPKNQNANVNFIELSSKITAMQGSQITIRHQQVRHYIDAMEDTECIYNIYKYVKFIYLYIKYGRCPQGI